ncbi:MAG: biopolymer transporter ExbD [Chlorobi bacterium]|nr:biopolymer transporter ExbD [Chlorobiota bacterium]
MALRRRSKVSASFSMSSMTDIVFLLLIFFMITSTLVHPNALKLVIPKKSVTTKNLPKYVNVRVTAGGSFYVNNRKISKSNVEMRLVQILSGNEKAVIKLRTDKNAKTGDVAMVLDIAETLGNKVVLDIR